MKRKNLILTIVFLIVLFSCKSVCKLEKVKTLLIVHLGSPEGPEGVSYAHDVLLKGFSKECLDSAFMVNLALKYMDTVKTGQPASLVVFYSSDKDFIPGEAAQNLDEIDRNCLVKIIFSGQIKTSTMFLFYNDKGENIYLGDRWNAQKKSKQAIIEK